MLLMVICADTCVLLIINASSRIFFMMVESDHKYNKNRRVGESEMGDGRWELGDRRIGGWVSRRSVSRSPDSYRDGVRLPCCRMKCVLQGRIEESEQGESERLDGRNLKVEKEEVNVPYSFVYD